MKKIVSVSLGSSTRDHRAHVTLMGEEFDISRVGMDGKLDAAIAAVTELDGHVDAIGLGGIDVYLYAGPTPLRVARRTAIARGREDHPGRRRQRAQKHARARGGPLHAGRARHRLRGKARSDGQRARSVRYGASARGRRRRRTLRRLHLRPRPRQAGARPPEFEELAEKYLPDACKLPFQFFYPTGKKQEKPPEPKYPQYYDEAEIIAGDFHFMRQFMPDRLDGKIVLTNTVTPANLDELTSTRREDADHHDARFRRSVVRYERDRGCVARAARQEME